MRNSIIVIIIGLIIGFASCNKDKSRTTILGSWNCEEYAEPGSQRIYQVNIERNKAIPDSTNEYKVLNFHNYGFGETTEVYIRETQKGILLITGSPMTNVEITGEGIVANDFKSIKWNYKVNDGVLNPLVVATYY